MVWGSTSFATFLIICPTSFFLGILFSQFPYDYPVLWTSTPSSPDTTFSDLESHLRFLHASPPLIPRIMHIVVAVGMLGFTMKLYKPSESNMLFDGASLVLYLCGITVYITNIVKGLRLVTAGAYGEVELVEGDSTVGKVGGMGVDGGIIGGTEKGIGREDSLRVLSASNTILALVLVGVLVLQAGQWYAERKDNQETEKLKKERREEAKERREEREKEGSTGSEVSTKGSSTGRTSPREGLRSPTGRGKKSS